MTVTGQGSSRLICELQFTLKENANAIINKMLHSQGNDTFVTQWVKTLQSEKKKPYKGKDENIFSFLILQWCP